jgi:hypothetical protein
MINYYTIFDLERNQVGFIGSVHVESIPYWKDFVYIGAIMVFFGSLIYLLMNYYKERRMVKIQIFESELGQQSFL